jgi:predicted enzyme related to lactoylglutathione lyase
LEKTAGFCWTELSTTDVAKATKFYARLFGWSNDPQPIRAKSGRTIDYTLLVIGRRNVGGLHPLVGSQRMLGASPRWLSYVFVDDVVAFTARAGELGATILANPLPVSDLGRLSILRDPQGAHFGAWQAMRLDGAFQTRNEPGFAGWFEHVSPDVSGAARFYGSLFGWSPRSSDRDSRVLLERDGVGIAGLSSSAQYGRDLSCQWLTFFQVQDCEASCEKITSLQGSVVVPPAGAPAAARFAVARDPQGAAFGILTRPSRP